MSDRGDYREPKAGDWMVIVHPHEGDVGCRKVERIESDPRIAVLNDGSKWGAETGAPVHARWRGHFLWPVDKGDLCGDIDGLLNDASTEALAEVYAVLLADKRARETRAWSPGHCVHCLAKLPEHLPTCAIVHYAKEDGITPAALYERDYGTPEKIAAAVALHPRRRA